MSLAWSEESDGEEVELEPITSQVVLNDIESLRKLKKITNTISQKQDDGRKFVWDIVITPKSLKGHMGLGVGVKETSNFQKGWFRIINLRATLINHADPERSYVQEACDLKISAKSPMVGWPQFCKSDILKDTTGHFIADGKMTLSVTIELVSEKGCSPAYRVGMKHDSKKATGYVGLKNQGATCYLNSLIQALFTIGPFRHGIYQMPTEDDDPKSSVPLALQRLFYKLQHGDRALSTKELTASFGWNVADVFQQQDVQELNRVLQDRIEEKMKGTPAEGCVPGLFRGKMVSYIKCLNVDYESKREEDFYDISLDVEGCANIRESFSRYTKAELLDGENQYDAEGHGHQDAEKGIKFLKFPPVLHLQLKRFAFDMQTLRNYKVNSRYEFDTKLELKDFLDPKSEHPNSDCTTYVLQGVFIHSGTLGGGHYFAFFRPSTRRQWFKFNDSHVTRVTAEHVEENSFGGKVKKPAKGYFSGATSTIRSNSAYMLQYIREDYLEQALAPVTDIPAHINQRFQHEAAADAERRRLKAEAHLYLNVKVFTDNDLLQHDRTDLIDFDRFRADQNFRVLRRMSFPEFQREHVAKVFGIPPERQRFWIFSRRQNQTVRCRYRVKLNEGRTIEELYNRSKKPGITDYRLLLDISSNEKPPYFETVQSTQGQLFFKYFDAELQTMKFVHRAFLEKSEPLSRITPKLVELLKLPSDVKLTWFEEIKLGRMDHIDPDQTLDQLELGNGDIVVFQVAPESEADLRESAQLVRAQLTTSGKTLSVSDQHHDTAKAYFEFLCARVMVNFKRKATYRSDPGVRLLLLNTDIYEVVQKRLAQQLGIVDHSHIQFTKHTSTGERPHWEGGLGDMHLTVSDLLKAGYYSAVDNDIIYYEELPCSVVDLATKKQVSVRLLGAKQNILWKGKVIVDQTGTIGDLKKELVSDLKRTWTEEEVDSQLPYDIRFFLLFRHTISKVFEDHILLESISNFARRDTEIYAEAFSEEDVEALKEGATLVKFVHTEPSRYAYATALAHGVPFQLVVPKELITVAQLHELVGARLGDRAKSWPLSWVKGAYGGTTKLEDEEETIDIGSIRDSDYFTITHAKAATSSLYYRKEKGIKIN